MTEYLTIPNFESLSEQEMFDMAARHLLTTRIPSITWGGDDGVCTYSNSGCAASVFLRPECRSIADGSGTWESLVSRGEAPPHRDTFVRLLQLAHDETACKTVDCLDLWLPIWKERMRRIAEQHQLDASILEEAA